MGIQIPYIYEFILVMFCNAFNLERQLSNVSCVVEEFMVGLDFMGLWVFTTHYLSITITDYYQKCELFAKFMFYYRYYELWLW